MPQKVYLAFLSLDYNIGEGNFEKSHVVRLYNEGDALGACDAMLSWNKAAGVVFPGLTKRREKERLMCIEGYMEGRFGVSFHVAVNDNQIVWRVAA
jgi:lysozyme